MIDSQPRFIQGIFQFTGAGYEAPVALASCTIAADKRAQPIYMRIGNSANALVSVGLYCDGTLLRLFPVGAQAAAHVQLAVVEDIQPDSRLELMIAAPAGLAGVLVVDFGLLEI